MWQEEAVLHGRFRAAVLIAVKSRLGGIGRGCIGGRSWRWLPDRHRRRGLTA